MIERYSAHRDRLTFMVQSRYWEDMFRSDELMKIFGGTPKAHMIPSMSQLHFHFQCSPTSHFWLHLEAMFSSHMKIFYSLLSCQQLQSA